MFWSLFLTIISQKSSFAYIQYFRSKALQHLRTVDYRDCSMLFKVATVAAFYVVDRILQISNCWISVKTKILLTMSWELPFGLFFVKISLNIFLIKVRLMYSYMNRLTKFIDSNFLYFCLLVQNLTICAKLM